MEGLLRPKGPEGQQETKQKSLLYPNICFWGEIEKKENQAYLNGKKLRSKELTAGLKMADSEEVKSLRY